MGETSLIEWNDNNKYQLINCKVNFITENHAQIQLYNLSPYLGMIYDTIENIDAKIAYQYHNSGNVKPWSFSLLKMHNYKKANERGFYYIKKGTRGFWVFNTIDLKIFEVLLETFKQELLLHFNQLKMKLISIDYGNKEIFQKNSFKTITTQLHSPTYFYRVKEKEYLPFTERTFLDFQLNKFKLLGLIKHFNIDLLLPFIRIIKKYTKKKYLSISIGEQTVRMYGNLGFITFKINGDDFTKELLWKLIHISQFTGIGTRSSMGFGHNSIIAIK